MIIKYDKEIEVTKTQYDVITRALSGVIAHREENGKYLIKVWHMGYADEVNKILEKTK